MRRFWLTCFGLLTALMLTWAIASPLASSPDEPSHFIRAAAVVRGEVIGGHTKDVPYATVQVPNYISQTRLLSCYFGDVNKSANCSHTITTNINKTVVSATSAGINSPVYYVFVGLPTLVLSGDIALYAMRLVSVIMAAALLASMFAVMRFAGASRWAFAGAIVGITPMALFLGGTVNPNTVEMASAGGLFVSLVVLLTRSVTRRQFVWLGTVAGVSALLLTGTRSISLLWLLLIAVGALAFTKKDFLLSLLRQRRTWIVVIGVAVIAVGALLWFTAPLPAGPASSALPAEKMSAARVAVIMLENTFDYWTGWIGYFGWLDQPSPPIVYIIWYVAIGVILAGGLFAGKGRARLVTIFFGIASLAIPVIVQSTLYASAGWLWQGRYLLAIDLCLLIAAGMAIDSAAERSTSRLLVRGYSIAVVFLAFGHFYAFMQTLRRYVVGGAQWWTMITNPLWQPPLTWFGVSLLFLLVLVASAWFVLQEIRRTSALTTAPRFGVLADREPKSMRSGLKQPREV